MNETDSPQEPSSPVPGDVDATTSPWTAGKPWRDYLLPTTLDPTATEIEARRLPSQEPVIIKSFPIGPDTPGRRRTWASLEELSEQEIGFLHPIEAVEENERRFEVLRVPPPTSLKAWFLTHPFDLGLLEKSLRDWVEALQTLHATGVALLSLSPHSVYVSSTPEKTEFLFGKLEDAAALPPFEKITFPTDLRFDPPERNETLQHPDSVRLQAWDWWRLGRVIQEWILGQPAVCLFVQSSASTLTPAEEERAQRLLADEEPRIRPGAVELMPEMDPMVLRLLRGLLTASPTGRWTGREIHRWLAGESVTDYYDLRPEEPLFVWKGHPLTPKEASGFFTQEEHWEDGERNLFPESPDTPALVTFLQQTPAYRAHFDRVANVLALKDHPDWGDVPTDARQTALASAAWAALEAPEDRALLRIRGRGMDWLGLQALFKADPTLRSVPLFRALMADPFLRLVEVLDPVMARSIKLFASGAKEAVAQGERLGWLPADSVSEQAQIFALALESSKDLEGHLKRLRATYSGHQNADVATLLATPKPDRWMLVLLAYAGESPLQNGFITRAEQNLDRYRTLRERADLLSQYVFWERLGRILSSAPFLYSREWVFGLLWLLLVGIAGFTTEVWLPGLCIFGAMIALRVLVYFLLKQWVRIQGATPSPWSWKDHAQRCRQELTRLRALLIPPPAAAADDLAQVIREIDAIDLQPKPTVPKKTPTFSAVRAASLVSAGAAFFVLFQIVLPVLEHDFSGARSKQDATQAKAVPKAAVPQFFDPPPGAPPGLYEEHNDGFGRQLRGPLITWDVSPDTVGPALHVIEQRTATPEQTAYALISGETVLQPYPTRGVAALLIVRVPLPGKTALMLFDANTRRLFGRAVYVVEPAPQERAWHRLAGHNGVFLGVPENLRGELAEK